MVNPFSQRGVGLTVTVERCQCSQCGVGLTMTVERVS